jgi:murein DD-endopeptidase MepM/ murein hydrolase activator NlpD
MRDYKITIKSKNPRKLRITGMHWLLLAVSVAVIASTIILIPINAGATRTSAPLDTSVVVTPLATAAEQAQTQASDAAAMTQLPLVPPLQNHVELKRHIVTVKAGDNLSKIFNRLGLSPRQLHYIMQMNDATDALKRLRPGQQLTFSLDPDNQIHDLLFEIDRRSSLHISRRGGVYLTSLINREFETRVSHAQGTIQRSLYQDANDAGMSDSLIMELVGIFGWDIDFALDLRKGDSFSLVFEEKYLDGQKVRSGPILAASFTSQGNTYQAIRYTDADGHTDYYAADGSSMRKAFLRTPVDFKRISSHFGVRKHPVLNKMRRHNGVDYAASRGTPVKATGDGKIIFRGRKGGYGNTVIIRHGGKYSTLYAHLNGFRKGLHTGKTIKQGDIIGYVGSTGLATGPHLHYEFLVHGAHRNPLKVKFPAATPIKTAYRKDFEQHAKGMLQELAQLEQKPTTVAAND